MISVVIPTLDAEASLAPTLAALVPAAVDGLVTEVIVADGGSTDRTRDIADGTGAEFLVADRGRGGQLAAGAARARGAWLLFLHADTLLAPGWEREASTFMERVDSGAWPEAAAVFRYALDDRGVAPRLLEMMVAARTSVLRLPYGDQGLLLPRRLYDRIGGVRPMPLMEDVDLVRRLGRRRIHILRATALTSAARYRHEGYLARVARNQMCLALYALGVAPDRIARLYHPRQRPAGEERPREASL